MFCKRPKSLVLSTIFYILIATLDGCARRQAAGIERLGVMPIENLSSSAELNWRSRAAAAVVVYDLAGAKNVFARQVDSVSAAQSMQASRLLQGYFFERNGRIGIRATLEDFGKTRAVECFEIEGAEAAGFLPLANELARRLSSDARTFGTSNENAFRYYGEALAARDPQGIEQALQKATDADAGFAVGYLDQAKVLMETGDRGRVGEILQAAQRARLDPIDRANFENVAAMASGDAMARMKALERLAEATPANAGVFKELGEMRYARRDFRRAAMEYRAAARLDPDEPQIWNELGYALAWSKDLSGAREALAQYQRLAPGDANVLDSQGEVSYMLGDFKAASEYFERAAAKNPAEFVKAAEARLMMGDRQGADVLFSKHFDAHGHSAGDYQMAQWEYLTGRRLAGMDRIETLAKSSNGDLQALGLSQLAVWKLDGGDPKGAAELAAEAATHAKSPQARAISGTARMAIEVYTPVFQKSYRESVPLLETRYAKTDPSGDGQIRTVLAWAYLETGEIDKAARLVDVYPFPLSDGDPMFASLIFPRYLSVRSAVLEHQGKKDEARNSRELYLKYTGPTK